MTKPKRRWFQINLSTAVVLMFVAGALMWANLHESQRLIITHVSCFNGVLEYDYGAAWERGWPLPVDDILFGVSYSRLSVDICVCVLLLLVAAVLMEASRQRSQPPSPFAWHNLTVIFLLLLAAGGLTANTVPYETTRTIDVVVIGERERGMLRVQLSGWPHPWYEFSPVSTAGDRIQYANLGIDVVMSLAAMLSMATACEYLIRCRSRHRP